MKRIFYGWYMVAAGSGLQFLQAGLMSQAFGAYVAVLQEERGWSKTALSGAAALQQMESAILGPLLGWVIDRFGPQGPIRAGVVIFGIERTFALFLDSSALRLKSNWGGRIPITPAKEPCLKLERTPLILP